MKWILKQWNSYKYRFVPWIALNINNKTTVKIIQKDPSLPSTHLAQSLQDLFHKFENYASLHENLELYSRLHETNQKILLHHYGFSLVRKQSSLEGAGKGVFILEGKAKKGSIVGIYPGTVYQPYQPVLFQSLRNPFLFRCADGVLIDGKDSAISRIIYKSCSPRDQIGMVKTSDTSWLTPWPVNPLNNGQYVNNGDSTEESKNPPNVCYQEVDLDLLSTFPLALRKFVPNVNYASISEDGYRDLRLVVLVATREICTGEEIFSSYFTLIQT